MASASPGRTGLPRSRREVIGSPLVALTSLLRLPSSDESCRDGADYSTKKNSRALHYPLAISVYLSRGKRFRFFSSQFRTFPAVRRTSEPRGVYGARRIQLMAYGVAEF